LIDFIYDHFGKSVIFWEGDAGMSDHTEVLGRFAGFWLFGAGFSVDLVFFLDLIFFFI
jgi:hypothetical protein